MQSTLVSLLIAGICLTGSRAQSTIPDYVLDYAPLVYLDVNERYFPSDIGAQVTHTHPAINYTTLDNVPSNLNLSDLSSLNSLADCGSFDDCDLYLTSNDFVPVDPPSPEWLYGVRPDPETGETVGATSCVVIVFDHQNGTTDAFYMYFYAFNRGVPVGSPNGTVYDDHVGDWEHTMVRFVNGQPSVVWYSQHSAGEVYTYDATLKNGSRPLSFSSNGGHANYAQDGIHVMYNGAANDSTSRGSLWDPIAGSGAWYYTFTPDATASDNGTFVSVNVDGRTSRGTGPTDFLYFFGRWGDKQYNSSHPGQQSLGTITSVFTDGPTGPLNKDLNRVEACPDRLMLCLTTSAVPVASGTVTASLSVSLPSGTQSASASASSTSTSQATALSQALRSDSLVGLRTGVALVAGLFSLVV